MRTPYDLTTAPDLDEDLPVFTTAAEVDFFDYQLLHHDGTSAWWDHRVPFDPAAQPSAAWECRQNPSGPFLRPVPGNVVPFFFASGGPNGAAYIKGGAADPAGVLLSDVPVIPTGADWTAWAVAYPGSSAQSVLHCVAGANGGGVITRLRSAGIVDVSLRTVGGVITTVASYASVPAATWHLVEVAWRQSDGRLTIMLNGTLVATVAGLSLAPHSGRLAVLGGYDATTGAILMGQGRDVGVAALGVVNTYSPGDAAWRGKLRAHLAAAPHGYPSIAVAA